MAADVVEATCPRCGCALVRADEPHAKGDGPARRHFLKRARTHGDGAPLEGLRGLGPASAKKLAKAGITDTEQLLAADARALHEETGIAHADLVRWQDMCDLLHLKGIGAPEATALVKAKVNSVAELAMQDPGTLAARLQTPQDDGTDEGPDLRLVTAWVKEARRTAPPPRSVAEDALQRAADEPEVPEDPVVTPAGVFAGADFDDATFRAECPRCAEGFHVARGTREGACPYCGHGHAFQADGGLAERERVDDARLAEDAVREAEQGFLRRFARRVRDGDRTSKTVTGKQRPAQPSAPRPSLFRRRGKGGRDAEPGDGDASEEDPAPGPAEATAEKAGPAEEKSKKAGGTKRPEKRPKAPKEKGREKAPVPLIEIACAHCGGAFRVKPTQRRASCPHCHTRLGLVPEEETEPAGAAAPDARLEERKRRAQAQQEKRVRRERLRKGRQQERRAQRAAKAQAREGADALPAGAETAAPEPRPRRAKRRKKEQREEKRKGSASGAAAASTEGTAKTEAAAEKQKQKEAAQQLAEQKARERQAAKEARARAREEAKAERARKKQGSAAKRKEQKAAAREGTPSTDTGETKRPRAAARREAQEAKRREKAERRAKAEAERREAEKARIAGLRSDSLWERAVARSMAPEEKEEGTWERSVAQGTGHRRRDSWAGVDGERLFARQERSGPQKVRLVDGRSLFAKLEADEKEHDPPRLPDERSAFVHLPEDEREAYAPPRLPDGRSPFESLPEDEHVDLDRVRAFGHRPGEEYTTPGGFRIVEEMAVTETPRERRLGSDRAALRKRQRQEEQGRRAAEKEAREQRLAEAREQAAKRRAERREAPGGGLLRRGKRKAPGEAAAEADRGPEDIPGSDAATAATTLAKREVKPAVAPTPPETPDEAGGGGLKRLFGAKKEPAAKDSRPAAAAREATVPEAEGDDVIAPGVAPAAEKYAEDKEQAAGKKREVARAAKAERDAAKEAKAREAEQKAEAAARSAKEKAEAARRRREEAQKAKLERKEARRRAAEDKARAAQSRREEAQKAKLERKQKGQQAAEARSHAKADAALRHALPPGPDEGVGRPKETRAEAAGSAPPGDATDAPARQKARKAKNPGRSRKPKEADRQKEPGTGPVPAPPSPSAPAPEKGTAGRGRGEEGEETASRQPSGHAPRRADGDLERRVDDLLRRRSG